jgi:alkylation response protein AidB-like acyl-CoA dehydrogenase
MNFLQDNADLRFYIDQCIDWELLHHNVELAVDDPESLPIDEAKEFYRDILNLVGEFSANEIAPHAAALDKAEIRLENGEVIVPPIHDQIFAQLAQMGLHGVCLPRELGGMHCPMMVYFLAAELIARGDVSVMTHHSFHGGIAMALLMYSMEEGSSRFDVEKRQLIETRFGDVIRTMAAGEAWGCMDITEPDAGSDMGALRTKAEQDEDGHWFITGQKIFVTSGHGRYHLVISRTAAATGDDAMAGLGGLSLFLVETYTENADGSRARLAHIERIEEKLGHHASATVTINFDRTPAQLIGKQGEGFRLMLLLMNNARVAVGFEALGICENAVRLARDYAAERHSMGKPIAVHELIADMLDEMQTDIQGIRALAVAAAAASEAFNRKRMQLQYLTEPDTPAHTALAAEVRRLGWKARMATPLVKYIAAEKAVEMGRRCVQIHGGCGYTTEYGAEKLLRDAMVLPIYEGTSQIQALMATKDSLLSITKNPSRFASRLADTWRRSTFSTDALDRRVAGIRYQALAAQKTLMVRILRDKWTHARSRPDQSVGQAFKDWDPKTDFGPALLHAERLTQMLADAAVCEALLAQVERFPERRDVLERYLERAEPRCADLTHRIRTTGDRLLRELNEEATPPLLEEAI